MSAVIRSELIKYRTVRSSVVLAILAVAVPVVLTALIAAFVGQSTFVDDDDEAFNVVTGTVGLTHVLVAVMGALVIAAEYRFNTIRVTFTAVPQRSRVLAAKLVVVAAMGLAIGLVTLVLNIAVAMLILGARDIDLSLSGEGMPRALVGTVVVTALYGLTGFGLGALFRAPVAAIVVVTVQPIIVEPILFALRSEVFKWLPFTAATAVTSLDPPEDFVQSPLAGGLALAAYAALFVLLGWLAVTRRDA